MTMPRVHVGQMIGLLEVLEDMPDGVDVARVAGEHMLELDDLLPAVDAARLLGLLSVKSGDLHLTEEGKEFLTKGSSRRKKLLNKVISNLGEFKAIIRFIRDKGGGEVSKDDLVGFLRREMPDVDVESTFHWIVEWGRYSLVLRYDSTRQRIRVMQTPA